MPAWEAGGVRRDGVGKSAGAPAPAAWPEALLDCAAMLSLDHLSLRRGVRLLVEDATLAVHPGQKVGLTGANGTGKSSLFALIQGQLSADAGELRLPAA